MRIKFFTHFLATDNSVCSCLRAADESNSLEACREPPRRSPPRTSVEFSVQPVRSAEPTAGEEATVRFKISGTNGRVPLSNLRPVAWVDLRASQKISDARACREKVQSFLQSSFTKRPTVELNAYFIRNAHWRRLANALICVFDYWKRRPASQEWISTTCGSGVSRAGHLAASRRRQVCRRRR